MLFVQRVECESVEALVHVLLFLVNGFREYVAVQKPACVFLVVNSADRPS